MKLLSTRELSEITVSALCGEAGVNRSTFYAHYENLWDVLEELEQEMDTALLRQFQWVEDTRRAMLDPRSFLALTRQMAAYPAFYRARLKNPNVQTSRFKFGLDWLMTQIVQPYAKSLNDTPLLPYYMAFGKAGIFEVLCLWLESGCRELPEEIAQLLYDMAIRQFLWNKEKKFKI